VAASVTVGDPVVVAGRLYTRDWTDSEGNLRTTYEMEAVSVGHDLSRGRGRFFRNKPAAVTSATETPEAQDQVRGETAHPIAEDEAPAVYGDGVLDGDEPAFEEVPATASDDFGRTSGLRGGGMEPFDTAMVIPAGDSEPDADDPEQGPAPTSEPVSAPDAGPDGVPGSDDGPVPGPRPAAGSRSSRRPEPASSRAEQRGAEGEAPARRAARSRSPRRQPVPA
jgi:single-strand DNA-binding protein